MDDLQKIILELLKDGPVAFFTLGRAVIDKTVDRNLLLVGYKISEMERNGLIRSVFKPPVGDNFCWHMELVK